MVRACHLTRVAELRRHHGFGPPCHQAGCHCYGQVHGGYGGNGKASVGGTWLTSRRKRRAFFSMHQSRLPSFFGTSVEKVVESSRRRGHAQQPLKPSSQEGPGLSPNKAGVLVRPGLRDRRRAQKASVATRAPPPLRVGLDGGTGQ